MDSEIIQDELNSETIVREAMQIALMKTLYRKGREQFQDIVAISGMRDAQEQLTNEQCAKASEEVLKYIFDTHPDAFDIGILLNIRSNVGQSFREGDDWMKHLVFVVKARNGHYFVGSPANLHRKKFALNLYQGSTMEEALSALEKEENGPFQYWNYAELSGVLADMISTGKQKPIRTSDTEYELPQVRWDGGRFYPDLIKRKK